MIACAAIGIQQEGSIAVASLPPGIKRPLSPAEAARWLTARGFAVSGRTVSRMVDRGELSAEITPDGWRRIRQSELERYVRDNA